MDEQDDLIRQRGIYPNPWDDGRMPRPVDRWLGVAIVALILASYVAVAIVSWL